jgi:phosphatidylglycerol:prolipoprotein diacylglycerol transferase
MHPRLVIPGTAIALQSHDVMVGAAVLVAALLGYAGIVREGIAPRRARWALALVAAATLLGGRLHFVLANFSLFADNPWRALRLASSGLHAPGAILGAVFGSLATLPLLRIPIARFADGLAPAVGVGIALARLGCFLHGCCYGDLCDRPWAVTLPNDSYVYLRQLESGALPPGAARTLPVHPLPLYFAASGLAISALLLWRRRRRRFVGELALTLLFLFALSSTLLEPIRADDPTRVYWGALPQLLWVSAAMTLASAAVLAAAEIRCRRGTRPQP